MCQFLPPKPVFNAEHDLKLSDVRVYMGKILFSFLSSFLLSMYYFGV